MKANINFSHEGVIYNEGDEVVIDDTDVMDSLKARKVIGSKEKKEVEKTTEKKENPTK